MRERRLTTRSHAVLVLVSTVLTVVTCAGLVVAVALLRVPAGVLPLVVIATIGLPMAAALEVPSAIDVLRGERVVASLRRHLERLPETEHPLGL